jgi:hypothetical protein
VRLNLSEEWYENFKNREQKDDIKRFLRRDIEMHLSECPPAFSQDEFELKVASIKVAYANRPLI